MNRESKLSFEEYFQAYYQQAFRYTMKKVSNLSTAEDITMDTFVACYRRFEFFDPQKAKFATWLYVSLNNRIKNYYRDHKDIDCLDDHSDIADSYPQMKQVANFIKMYRGTVKINIESCYSPLLAIVSETPIFGNLNVRVNKGCLAGISRFSVSVDGKLSPCRHLDLYEDRASLEEYRSNSRILAEIRNLHESKDLPCAGCYYEKYCRPCLAVEHKINGSFYAGNRLCPVAEKRWSFNYEN